MRKLYLWIWVGLLPLISAAPASRTAEDASMKDKCAALLAKWKPKFDKEELHYVVAEPFVIAGDGSERAVAGYRDNTILPAVRSLKAMYMRKEMAEPVLILLIESEGPYKRLAKLWLNDNDPPHFGYFRHDGIMFMNISTGGGTLVHELVHALIKPDFPDVPDWFNEGLASLYEQCRFVNEKRIEGLVNWRLPALQGAIRQKKLRPLEELIKDEDFYNDRLSGINYAQARYLMMYLQQRGLLKDYYDKFREKQKEDPTGLNTLKAAIAPQKLDQFEKNWREWVMGLRWR